MRLAAAALLALAVLLPQVPHAGASGAQATLPLITYPTEGLALIYTLEKPAVHVNATQVKLALGGVSDRGLFYLELMIFSHGRVGVKGLEVKLDVSESRSGSATVSIWRSDSGLSIEGRLTVEGEGVRVEGSVWESRGNLSQALEALRALGVLVEVNGSNASVYVPLTRLAGVDYAPLRETLAASSLVSLPDVSLEVRPSGSYRVEVAARGAVSGDSLAEGIYVLAVAGLKALAPLAPEAAALANCTPPPPTPQGPPGLWDDVSHGQRPVYLIYKAEETPHVGSIIGYHEAPGPNYTMAIVPVFQTGPSEALAAAASCLINAGHQPGEEVSIALSGRAIGCGRITFKTKASLEELSREPDAVLQRACKPSTTTTTTATGARPGTGAPTEAKPTGQPDATTVGGGGGPSAVILAAVAMVIILAVAAALLARR